jgi:ATP-dependent Lon protease
MDTIPGPLRDRMETIWLSGYDLPEKVPTSIQ